MLGCASEEKLAPQPAQVQSAASSKTTLTSEIPPSDPLARSIRDQVERNWNLGSLAGAPDLSGMMVQLRLELLPDGTVSKVEVENGQPGNPTFQQVADSAVRAVKISSPLKLPRGRTFKVMHLRFHPNEVIE
jgi:hypothetical protein